jgi:RNA polymerase sigma-70 factor (ECF subfamily)
MNEQTLSDTELLKGLRAGEEESASQLVRSHAGRMLAVARRFLSDEHEAQDAVQEAFASAFKAIGRFRGDSSLGTWLHRIVVNAALKRVKAKEQRAETGLDDLLPVFDQANCRLEPLQGTFVAVEQLMAQQETRKRVRGAIAMLPDSYRAAILLRDIEGYNTSEAAEKLKISPGALKVRLHRGRSALKRLLEPILEEGT